ncbi:hypothetical protein RIF29_18157 [Crotalaria pallida]|uniref:Amino acid transporter transmembrane domain-containing protein n=1 Tax=Crotalaria pallida TaxID=3830 RepID=A0AAN9FS73_CROPI
MGEEAIDYPPLIQSFSSDDDVSRGQPAPRTGNVWSAVAHIITGVIGAGVLSLAWSVSQLGWIAGPLCIILFAIITLVSSYLLCDCYRFLHPDYGNIRSSSYIGAVKLYLGEKRKIVCGVLVNASLYGCTIAYIITAATCIRYDEGLGFDSAKDNDNDGGGCENEG